MSYYYFFSLFHSKKEQKTSNYTYCEETCYMIISPALFCVSNAKEFFLTSFFHMTLEAVGLEVMLHSKYTSSPSFISEASKLDPNVSSTTGGSVWNYRKRGSWEYTELKSIIQVIYT